MERTQILMKHDQQERERMKLNRVDNDERRNNDNRDNQVEKAQVEQQKLKNEKLDFEEGFKKLYEATGTSHGEINFLIFFS